MRRANARAFNRHDLDVAQVVLSDGQATYTPGASERRSTTMKFLTRGLKNTAIQTTATQGVGGTRMYDAFGNADSATGTWTGPSGYGGAFGYQEELSSLKLPGHRYYDSTTGGFISRDPARAGRNWYASCSGSPVAQADPLGLDRIIIVRGNQTDGGDISGYTNDIIGDYKKKHPKDEIIVVDNVDDAYKLLEDADALVLIGHHEPITRGIWGPFIAGIFVEDGNVLDPHVISKRSKGKRLKWIHVVTCSSLSHVASAEAWSRLSNGELWGWYGGLAKNQFAWGWFGLKKYKKGQSLPRAWSGGKKLGW